MATINEPAVQGPRAPQVLQQHLLGVTQMAVVLLGGRGRITHWSRAAAELFGIEPGQAIGRRLRMLLRLPREHLEAFEPAAHGCTPNVWTGVFLVSRVDDRTLREVAWWVYPLTGGTEIGVLAIAADASRLRDEGPGLALGDALIMPPAEALSPENGLRMLRVEPTLQPVTDYDAVPLGRRLLELLALTGPEIGEHIVAQVLRLGYPAINVSVTVRLPFAPYWGQPPQASVRYPPVPPQAEPRETPGEAAAARERMAFLTQAAAAIGLSLDPVETARELTAVLVPRFVDFACVMLLEEFLTEHELPARTPAAPRLRRVAVAHSDEPGRWEDTVPVGELYAPPPGTLFARALRSGRSVYLQQVTGELSERIAAQFNDRDLRPLIDGRALMVVPLIARGSVFGNLVLMRRMDRRSLDEMDLATIEEIAGRAALCIDNGRLYRREVHVATELQRAMLPAQLPEVAGARVCYRYRPAVQAARPGGDWFDAIPLPGSRLALVVGDVMGHGLTSAAIMGQLRTAVRTLAAQDLRPDRLLRQLDDLAQRLGELSIATCVYVVYDPVARRCQVANAGHVPPVLISPCGDGELLRLPTGAPIGVGGVAFETVEFAVPDGTQLVLCTDGLVETRGRDIDDRLTELAELLAGPAQPLDDVCEMALEALYGSDRSDDVALLAVRFEGVPPEDVVSWTLRAELSVVGHTRELTRKTLADWGLSSVADTVELLVSELVTNAFLHGGEEIGLRLIRANALLCEVFDDGFELPYLCHADVTDEHGRGLHLVSHLAERWGTSRTPTGKVVWFEHAIPR